MELDSHANMILLGRDAYVFDSVQDRTCNVQPFDPALGTATKVPIVDAAIAYDCPVQNKTFILLLRNALHHPRLDHSLIPPFIMREACIQVAEVPKIHIHNPTKEDHSIFIPDLDLRIPLQLSGIFSFFHYRKPTNDEVQHCSHAFITPDTNKWDPYSTHYAENEEAMLDWEGNMIDERHRKRIKLNNNKDDEYDISTMKAEVYELTVDRVTETNGHNITVSNDVTSGAQCDVEDLAVLLSEKATISKASIAIGSQSIMSDGMLDDLFVKTDKPVTFHYDDNDPIIKEMLASTMADKPKSVSPEFLSKIWHIKNEEAVKVLDQSTQLCRRGADNSLSRQHSTNDRMLRYRRINSVFFTDTFFVTAKGKSTRGNKAAQIFVSDKGFVMIYPMESKSMFLPALKLFCKEVGVPESLVCDPSGEQRKTDIKHFCHQVGTTLRLLQESTQWANRAELYVGLFKESIRQDLRRSNAPMVLWDYCAERRARIHNVIPKSLFQLQGVNPYTATFGQEPDISNICMFDWYDWCYFREENAIQFPFQKEQLGRVLGPLKNEGNEMVQSVLKANGRIVPRRTCRRLTAQELESPSEKQKRDDFDAAIRKRYGDSITVVPSNSTKRAENDSPDIHDLTSDADDEPAEPPFIADEDPVDSTGKAVYQQPFTDQLLHSEVLLPQGEEFKSGRVVRRATDVEGNTIGSYNENPMLNTTIYEVEFTDGSVREYGANIIAENIYQQVDSNGHMHNVVESILDHQREDNALDISQKYVITRKGQKRLRKSTVGWKFLVQYKHGEEQWIPLRILKETNPVQVAEYAKSRGIDNEVAFSWWVPYTLRKKDRIISAVKSRVKKATHKYGIEVPTSVEHAFSIDSRNGNTAWKDAIDKEMKNVAVAFQILEKNDPIPVGWTKSSGHMVFDVKMDFTKKARWVKDGHRTPEPDQATFAGVVSRESVRIALTYAALNDLDVTAADIKNAYLQAPSSEKHYVICGEEFGLEHVGKVALIKRALYGGKASGADFWRHLRTCMHHLGFTPCKGDGEIWMRPAVKDSGEEYWEYVLLYVDDVLCISMNGRHIIENGIGKYFYVKESSIGPPDIYLGNKVSQVTLPNGHKAWAWSSSQYVQNAVKNIEDYLREHGKSGLSKKATAPYSREYRPELDTTPELSPREAAHYQSLIGVLRWIVELGRADVTVEASQLASCLAMPRVGHLEQLYNVFAYLKAKHNSEMIFDPTEPDIDEGKFQEQDWSASVYTNAKETIPPDMPQPRGFGFKIRAYVDSDHAGNEKTRRSRTGFMVFLNSAPIYWTSKKQGSRRRLKRLRRRRLLIRRPRR